MENPSESASSEEEEKPVAEATTETPDKPAETTIEPVVEQKEELANPEP